MQGFPGGHMKKQRVFWICMLVLLYSVYAGYWWDRFMTIIHCGTSEPFFQLNAVQRMITIKLPM